MAAIINAPPITVGSQRPDRTGQVISAVTPFLQMFLQDKLATARQREGVDYTAQVQQGQQERQAGQRAEMAQMMGGRQEGQRPPSGMGPGAPTEDPGVQREQMLQAAMANPNIDNAVVEQLRQQYPGQKAPTPYSPEGKVAADVESGILAKAPTEKGMTITMTEPVSGRTTKAERGSDFYNTLAGEGWADAEIPKEKAKDYSSVDSIRKELSALPETKTYTITSRQIEILDKAMEDVRGTAGQPPEKRNLIAVDQALITILNKMMDPTSVVRESEYARTPGDQAMMSRVKGYFKKFTEGGAGLTDPEREAIYDMGKKFSGVAASKYGESAKYYQGLAEDRGFESKDVVRLPIPGEMATPTTQEDFDAMPSGTVYTDPDDGKQYRKP